MDQMVNRRRDPLGKDITAFNNWLPIKERIRAHAVAQEQRSSIERLHGSPKANTRMG